MPLLTIFFLMIKYPTNSFISKTSYKYIYVQ